MTLHPGQLSKLARDERLNKFREVRMEENQEEKLKKMKSDLIKELVDDHTHKDRQLQLCLILSIDNLKKSTEKSSHSIDELRKSTKDSSGVANYLSKILIWLTSVLAAAAIVGILNIIF